MNNNKELFSEIYVVPGKLNEIKAGRYIQSMSAILSQPSFRAAREEYVKTLENSEK